jgi:Flp pilus assembly protein TadD
VSREGGAPVSGSGDGEAWPAGTTTLHLLLILLVGVACYAHTLQVPFVLDDRTSIVENQLIKDLPGFLADGFSQVPRRFVGYLTFALNYKLGGLQLRGYHLVNLGVHLLTSLLVYCFCRLTCTSRYLRASRLVRLFPLISLFAALLFVAHPLQTQAVTYLSQRVASLAALFYLLSLTCHARARQLQAAGTSPWRPVLLWSCSLAAALLAMTTKETAFTLPFMLLVYDLFFFPAGWRKRLPLVLPVLLAIILIPIFFRVTPGDALSSLERSLSAATRISRWDYFLTQLCVITTYLRLLFLPIGQNLDYDYPLQTALLSPRALGSLLLLSGLLMLAAFLFRRSRSGEPSLRLASFGIVWFFIALSVESSIIPITDVIFEHRLYLPSVGIFIAFSAVLAYVATGRRTGPLTACIVGITAMLACATWQRNLIWSDEVTLWRDTVHKSSGKDRPHANLGKALLQKGRVEEAIRELETALSLNPGNGEAWSNLGAADMKKGDYEAARKHLRTAVKLIPNSFAARYNLGLVLTHGGRTDLAAAEFMAAVQLNPYSAEAHNHLAIACASLEMKSTAIELFREAVRLAPGKAEYGRNIDVVLMRLQGVRR